MTRIARTATSTEARSLPALRSGASLRSTSRRLPLLSMAIAVAMLLSALPAVGAAKEQANLGELIDKLPAKSAEQAESVYKAILAGKAEAVARLANMVTEPDKGNDAKARYALHGLATYVCRPGAEAERKLVAAALAGLLDGDRPAPVKAFWIRRLQLCGRAEAVGPLAHALRDEALCEPAAQALLAIGADAEVFRDALPDVPASCRATVVQALGSKRDAKSVPGLLKLATADDGDVRTVAIEALGNIGDARAKETLLQAAGAEGYGRYAASDACLRLARRLAEAEKPRDAEGIFRSLLRTHTKPQDRQVRCAAVLGLVETLGEDAIDDLLSAMKETDAQVRTAAIDAGADLPGKEATGKWIAAARNAKGELRASVIELLARRGEAESFPVVLEAMKDADESVRLAAIAAAAKLGKDKSAAALVAAMDGSDAEGSAAGRELRGLPGQKASTLIAGHVATASPRVRARLLRVLAARGASEHLTLVFGHTADEDASVRIAAMEATGTLGDARTIPKLVELLKGAGDDRHRDAAEKALEALCRKVRNPDRTATPLLDALGGSPVEVRCALLRVLGEVPADAALEAIRRALKDDNDVVRYTALRAIAGWADERAADDLLALAKNASDIKNHAFTLQGLIRVVGDSRKLTSEEKVAKLQAAVELARRADEKKQALGKLRNIHTPQALALVAECMDDKAVAQEAASAKTLRRLRRSTYLSRRSPAKADPKRNDPSVHARRVGVGNHKRPARPSLNAFGGSGAGNRRRDNGGTRRNGGRTRGRQGRLQTKRDALRDKLVDLRDRDRITEKAHGGRGSRPSGKPRDRGETP